MINKPVVLEQLWRQLVPREEDELEEELDEDEELDDEQDED